MTAVIIFFMLISEIGEFGLIKYISEYLSLYQEDKNLIVGIGDDTAVWSSSDNTILHTTDTLVENVHFRLDYISWQDLGWKALAINLSDIAAMGGIPRYALVSLCIPDTIEVEDIMRFYEGMLNLARLNNVIIAGGNISRSEEIVITVALTGAAGDIPGNVMLRSKAISGDLVAVTGYLGSSALGLKILNNQITLPDEVKTFCINAHLKPQPRVKEGQALLKMGIRCAIDISDGLVGDLYHICEASRISADISQNKLPVIPEIKQYLDQDFIEELALYGGEDYELLVTGREELIDKARSVLTCPLTIIGEVTSEESKSINLVNDKNKIKRAQVKGWDHFAK